MKSFTALCLSVKLTLLIADMTFGNIYHIPNLRVSSRKLLLPVSLLYLGSLNLKRSHAAYFCCIFFKKALESLVCNV